MHRGDSFGRYIVRRGPRLEGLFNSSKRSLRFDITAHLLSHVQWNRMIRSNNSLTADSYKHGTRALQQDRTQTGDPIALSNGVRSKTTAWNHADECQTEVLVYPE